MSMKRASGEEGQKRTRRGEEEVSGGVLVARGWGAKPRSKPEPSKEGVEKEEVQERMKETPQDRLAFLKAAQSKCQLLSPAFPEWPFCSTTTKKKKTNGGGCQEERERREGSLLP